MARRIAKLDCVIELNYGELRANATCKTGRTWESFRHLRNENLSFFRQTMIHLKALQVLQEQVVCFKMSFNLKRWKGSNSIAVINLLFFQELCWKGFILSFWKMSENKSSAPVSLKHFCVLFTRMHEAKH